MKLGGEHYSEQLKRKILSSIRAGYTPVEIARRFGISRSTLYRWIGRAKTGKFGLQRLHGTGRRRSLSLDQVNQILAYTQHPASQFDFDNDLWTTPRLAILIQDALNIKLHRSTVHRMLTEQNYSSKSPEYRWSEADVITQKFWLKNTVPAIRSFLKKKRAILYFFDESSISLTPSNGRTWGPRGKTTIIQRTGKKGSVSALSAISPKGSLVFKVKTGTVKSPDVISFLKTLLLKHKNRKIAVILDNAPSHTSKMVYDFADSNKRLMLFYLPAYSPEWNADEKVWNHLKSVDLVAHQEKDISGLLSLTRRKLQGMARRPKLLRGLFRRCEISEFFER